MGSSRQGYLGGIDLHVNAAVLLGHQQADQVGIAAVGQAQVQVRDDGDGDKQLRGLDQGGEQHHGAVGAADSGYRSRLPRLQTEAHAHRQGDEGTQLGKQGNGDAGPGLGQQEADLTLGADTHEHQAGDEPVGEHEVIDGLEAVDLQDVHQLRRIADQGIQQQGADGAVTEEEHAGVDADHAQPHGDHDEGLQLACEAHVGQNKACHDQNDAGDGDGRLLGQHRADAREEGCQQFHGQPSFLPPVPFLWERLINALMATMMAITTYEITAVNPYANRE